MKTCNVILKNTLFGLLTLAFIFCTNALMAQETSKLQGLLGKAEQMKTEPISIQVRFNRGKRTRGCLGGGACGVEPYNVEKGKSQLGERQYLATISRKGDKFTISIENDDISMATYNEQFASNSFEVAEDLELPVEVCQQLGIKGKAKIVAGNYAVAKQVNSLMVVPALIVNY